MSVGKDWPYTLLAIWASVTTTMSYLHSCRHSSLLSSWALVKTDNALCCLYERWLRLTIYQVWRMSTQVHFSNHDFWSLSTTAGHKLYVYTDASATDVIHDGGASISVSVSIQNSRLGTGHNKLTATNSHCNFYPSAHVAKKTELQTMSFNDAFF